MPLGIVILEFDPFEGNTIYYKYPEDFEVSENYLQQIAISHNFISSILLNRDENINALSFYNGEYKKTVIIFLSQNEDAQDFYETIRQLDNLFLKKKPKEDIIEEIQNIFKFSQSITNVKHEVLVKFANELSEAKSREDDYRRRLEKIFELCDDNTYTPIDIKILIALTLKDFQTKNELFTTRIRGTKTDFEKSLEKLQKKGLIKVFKNNKIMINV
ncbi:MAG: hypothetical protein ACTSRZ_12180 [Promethearchaeota archaeon]